MVKVLRPKMDEPRAGSSHSGELEFVLGSPYFWPVWLLGWLARMKCIVGHLAVPRPQMDIWEKWTELRRLQDSWTLLVRFHL